MLTNFTKTFDTEEFSFYLDEFVDYFHMKKSCGNIARRFLKMI